MKSNKNTVSELTKVFIVGFIAIMLGFIIDWGVLLIVLGLGLAVGPTFISYIIGKKVTCANILGDFFVLIGGCLWIVYGFLFVFSNQKHFWEIGMYLGIGNCLVIIGNVFSSDIRKKEEKATSQKKG